MIYINENLFLTYENDIPSFLFVFRFKTMQR